MMLEQAEETAMSEQADRVIFETERFYVREWRLSDVDAAFAIYRSDNVQRFLSRSGGQLSPDESLRQIEIWRSKYPQFPGYGFWAMVEKATEGIDGAVALKPLSGGPEIEVGYHLGEFAWGKGYATEIARGAVRYGFEKKGLDRIVGVCDPQNHASFRVLQKAGLMHEGRQFHYDRELEYLAIDRARYEMEYRDR
jgi:RimJ/RimL family protein N-acetyltransferase